MTFPTGGISTSNVDSPTDAGDPAAARVEFKALIEQFNQLVAHHSPLLVSVLEMTTAPAVLGALGAAKSGVNNDITSLDSPALGAATVTTQAQDNATTKAASTAFVINQAGASAPLAAATAAAVGTSKRYSRQDHVHPETGLGASQSWVSYTGSRGLGATYTNSGTRPIQVAVSATQTGPGSAYLQANIPTVGDIVTSGQMTASTAFAMGLLFTVPAGKTFTVTCPTGAYAIVTNWKQLE